jgi:transcriptional regulator with XRE-family HTH domain
LIESSTSSKTVIIQPEIPTMPHEVDIHVGQKLKQARTLRRYSQTDVARHLKLSFQQVQKYEIGSNRIAASRLFELSKILGVTTSYFFEGLAEDAATPADNAMDIVSAVASIKDEQLKARISTFIQDVAGTTTARTT